MSNKNKNGKLGLHTKDALRQLKNDINAELIDFGQHSSWWIWNALRPSNQNALVIWPTVLLALGYGLALLVVLAVRKEDAEANFLLLVQALLLWTLTAANLLLVYHEDRLSKQEIPNRVRHSLDELERAANECCWGEENYPHLCAPFSPCVTLQWTYRDGKLVNLPWALLVRKDVVMLKPGQEAPGHCRALEDPSLHLAPRQLYQPPPQSKEVFGSPRATQPHKNRLFEMIETPYLSNLRLALQKALDRPVTVHNKQKHLVIMRFVEGVLLPVCLCASLLVVGLQGMRPPNWAEAFLQQPVAITLPLLPTAFPIVWTALNIYGMSKFNHLLQSSNRVQGTQGNSGTEEQGQGNPLLQGRDTRASLAPVWRTCISILLGRENLVTRSANIVHVLGSVSALCCVDKKGILSWPNPTAEKVFFLRNSSSISRSSSKSSFLGSAGHLGGPESQHQQQGSLTTIPHLNSTTVAEVLDLTHDQNIPFKLEFDDHSWKNHLSCLKPLGLAILVNTCNMDTQEHYTNFCSHLTCEATQSEDVVPVTNRRCLCELAKQIGFVEEARSIYTLQTHLATFRHLPPEVVRRDTKFARSLHLSTRVKVPLPHMLGVVIRDQAGGLQLITQGTADIILDSCSEYWNGQDLCVLSPSDRKKVLDFYQRSSLTAYCSAFAYRPLTRGVCPRLSAMYLELPADCRSLYPPTPGWSEPHPPLTSHYHSTDSLLFNDSKEEDVTDVEGYFDLQCNQVFIGMVTMQYQAQSDMVELIERLDRACIRFVHFSKENELRSRVFSEKMGLESGWNCHISLSGDENKAVSPATSQNLPTPSCSEKGWKGGVEHAQGSAGGRGKYNDRGDSCGEEGINFLPSTLEACKALSSSAPGAINLDHSTVKFDSETSHVRYCVRDDSLVSQNQQSTQGGAQQGTVAGGGRRVSQDSVLGGGWDREVGQEAGTAGGNGAPAEGEGEGAEGCRSLSCLTDSTDHSAPVNFDMRNRAKLPRGIDNIRPHIEQVDNVPLLVSLFTDCTAGTARRMLGIMQDYGQVVCVMGSAANKDNMEIFMQADASIAVEPLYPVLCQKVPPYQLPRKGLGPIDLARTLNSIPCSISVCREADVSLFSLVTLARHLMLSIWSASQYWICAICSLTLLQLISLVCGVPQIMSVGSVLWECVVVIPVVSTALALVPLDPSVMANATNKLHTHIDLKMCLFVMWCYGYKFLPSIIFIVVSYVTLLRSFCQELVAANNSTECISVVFPRRMEDVLSGVMLPGGLYQRDQPQDHYVGLVWRGWGDEHFHGYVMAQQMVFFMTTVLFLTISVSFVHREYSIWQKNIFTNKTWAVCVIALLLVQAGLWSVTCLLHRAEANSLQFHYSVPHLVVAFISPLVVLAINELIKWQEIKANLRYQRRARLDFGTKLGMNSPF